MNEPAQKAVNRLKAAAAEIEESADRRTILAADRTIFAAERTYAAWVRTGLDSLAAGVGAKAALGQVMVEAVVLAAGSVLVLFSAFCLEPRYGVSFSQAHTPRPDVRQLPSVLLIALNGFLVLVALIAFVGIWTARHSG